MTPTLPTDKPFHTVLVVSDTYKNHNWIRLLGKIPESCPYYKINNVDLGVGYPTQAWFQVK